MSEPLVVKESDKRKDFIEIAKAENVPGVENFDKPGVSKQDVADAINAHRQAGGEQTASTPVAQPDTGESNVEVTQVNDDGTVEAVVDGEETTLTPDAETLTAITDGDQGQETPSATSEENGGEGEEPSTPATSSDEAGDEPGDGGGKAVQDTCPNPSCGSSEFDGELCPVCGYDDKEIVRPFSLF